MATLLQFHQLVDSRERPPNRVSSPYQSVSLSTRGSPLLLGARDELQRGRRHSNRSLSSHQSHLAAGCGRSRETECWTRIGNKGHEVPSVARLPTRSGLDFFFLRWVDVYVDKFVGVPNYFRSKPLTVERQSLFLLMLLFQPPSTVNSFRRPPLLLRHALSPSRNTHLRQQ